MLACGVGVLGVWKGCAGMWSSTPHAWANFMILQVILGDEIHGVTGTPCDCLGGMLGSILHMLESSLTGLDSNRLNITGHDYKTQNMISLT